MPKQGIETGRFGQWLVERFAAIPRPMNIFYDHGDRVADSAHVTAILGFHGNGMTNLERLTDVDIAIATPENEIVLLMEIEEREFSPKKLLGDILAVLLCSGFRAKPRGTHSILKVTPKTRFIFAGTVPDKGKRLRRIKEVVLPRLGGLGRLPSGLDPANVELIVSHTLSLALERLKKRTEELLLVDAVE